MKIMIVEDHADMRRVLKNIISVSDSELEIIECEMGEDALAIYMVHRPDWVLMDIELKTMSGFEVIEQIYALDSKANIIIVTSYDTPTFRRKAKQLNIKRFISKETLSDINKIISTTSN